jgi:LysM repeat protein
MKQYTSKFMSKYSYFIVFCLLVALAIYTMGVVFAEANDYQTEPYVVQKGDTLWNIAKSHHQNVGMSIQHYIHQLKQVNDMHTPVIYVGQELTVLVSKAE